MAGAARAGAAPGAGLPGFQVVVAATAGARGIGRRGGLPWSLPPDLRYFARLTRETRAPGATNAVIMGRRTWESLPARFRPLPGRLNLVLSRSGALALDGAPDGGQENDGAAANASAALGAAKPGAGAGEVRVVGSLEAALEHVQGREGPPVETVFVIGGGQVYEEAVRSPLCQAVHLTAVELDVECDTHFPDVERDHGFRLWASSAPRAHKDVRYAFKVFVPRDGPSAHGAGVAFPPAMAAGAGEHAERQYLGLIREIIDTGNVKGDRTGTGTLSKFGAQMRFNLRDSFPLLTTKRVFWRGVAEELLWFVQGRTNAKELQAKKIHIWDGNGSREFLDKNGLGHREEGDLGPVYGFQWRHFGAEYTDMHADYAGKGVDQLAEVIDKIRHKPEDRRIIMSAWNPVDIPQMALPPCHCFCQFYVAAGELSCQMYQRSCDLGLGVPFNIASYALLTCLLAKVCDLAPGDFVHTLGDAHVYSNHVEPLEEQLKNSPRPFPKLKINTDTKDIDAIRFEDLELVDYQPHKKIAMQMAV